jgi:hypothetical protein
MTHTTGPSPDKDVVNFDEMPLRPGEQMRLTSQDPGASIGHYAVRYIGALPGEGLITTLPVAGDKGVWMPPGAGYVVRVLSGTHVYAFTTRVIRARATPYPHVHFQYPGEVQARKVRQSLRVGMHLNMEVVDEAGRPQPATLLDLSLHGARLETGAPPDGERVRLNLLVQLEEAQDRLSLPARVRNQQSGDLPGQGQVTRLGVEFEPLEKREALLLHYFIDHAIAEHGAELL